MRLFAPVDPWRPRYRTGQGFPGRMPVAHSAMERSPENLPELTTLRFDLLANARTLASAMLRHPWRCRPRWRHLEFPGDGVLIEPGGGMEDDPARDDVWDGVGMGSGLAFCFLGK
jgi:hypothetical protein